MNQEKKEKTLETTIKEILKKINILYTVHVKCANEVTSLLQSNIKIQTSLDKLNDRYEIVKAKINELERKCKTNHPTGEIGYD